MTASPSLPIRALGWCAAAVVCAWLIMSATYPFGWDQGIFAWAGGVIRDGGLPYRDAWDLKGPLVYYVYALAQLVFGAGLWAIRLVDAVVLLATAWAIVRILTTLTDSTFARLGAAFYVLWYASFSYWHTAQPDGWTGMLMTGAIAAVILKPEAVTPARAAAAGVACGLAALFKPFWLLFVLAVATPIWLGHVARRLSLLVALVAGCLAPIGAAVFWFAVNGALDDFLQVHLRDAATYASLVPVDRVSGFLDSFSSSRTALVVLPLAIYGALTLRQRNRCAAAAFLSWAVIVFVGVWIQGRFFGYHWLPALPVMAMLGVVGLHAMTKSARVPATIAAAAMVGLAAAPVVYEVSRFGAWQAGRLSTEAYYDAYGQSGPEMRAVAWMRGAPVAGKVFVFGWNPGIAWLNGRDIVSRFGFSMPLLSGPADRRARYVSETMSALVDDPPAYFIEGDLSARVLGRAAVLADVPDLDVFVARRYREVARFGPIVIHERRVD